MARTRHMHQRIGQRGVASRLVDLTSQFGTDSGDRVVLDRKNIEELLAGLDGTCQPDSDRSLKINVDFAAVLLAAESVGKFTTL